MEKLRKNKVEYEMIDVCPLIFPFLLFSCALNASDAFLKQMAPPINTYSYDNFTKSTELYSLTHDWCRLFISSKNLDFRSPHKIYFIFVRCSSVFYTHNFIISVLIKSYGSSNAYWLVFLFHQLEHYNTLAAYI